MAHRVSVVLAVLTGALLPASGAAAQEQTGDSKEQQVAVAPDGSAVFTWLRWNGSNWIALARARGADGTLSAVRELSARGGDARSPRVAIDDQGDAVFVWARSTETATKVQTRARSAAGVWSATQDLSPVGEVALDPVVDVDADGDAVFGWLQSEDDAWIVRAKARTAAGTLSPGQRLSSGESAFTPGVAVDGDGDAVFVWQRNGLIQTKRRAKTGALSSNQNLGGPEAARPDVGIDDAGNAVFTWTRRNSSQSTLLFTRRRAAGGTLTATQVVSAIGDTALPWAGALAVDDDGDAAYVWEAIADNGDGASSVKGRRRLADGTLTRTDTLALGRKPAVAVDGGGSAVVTWLADNDGDVLVRARGWALGETPSPVQSLAVVADGFAFGVPAIGVDGLGNAVLAWARESDTAADLIQGKHRDSSGGLSPLFTIGD